MHDPDDQRDFTRIHTDIIAELTAPDGQTMGGRLVDLSLSGLQLSLDAKCAEGQTCEVTLVLPGAEPPIRITAKGTVTRCEPGHLALEFAEIDDESYTHLRNLVLVNAVDPAQVEDELESSVGIKRQPPDF